jgi:hypothetical protein
MSDPQPTYLKPLRKGTKHGTTIYRCVCNKEKEIRTRSVRNGHTKSCGCMKVELTSTHGMAGEPEYMAYHAMMDRCNNSEHSQYADYGGRGIKVCKRWAESFENFFADVGPKPSPEHYLDRYPNNDGNYEPGNVRWSTPLQSARNRRNNKVVEFLGRPMCMSAWAEHFGITRFTLFQMVKRRGEREAFKIYQDRLDNASNNSRSD